MTGTLKYSEIKPEYISFTTFKDYKLVKYLFDGDLVIQSPWINLFAYGIPKKDKFNPTDNSRKHIKIPLNNQDPEVSAFTDLIKDIDATIKKDSAKQNILGDNYNKFDYSSMYKESQTEGRPSYIKLKLDTAYDDEQSIKTKLFKTKFNKDGTIEREQVFGITNIDDFSNLVPYRSDIRFIFKIVRCWSQAPNLKNPSYGLTLKITKLEVKERLADTNDSDNDFIDDVISSTHVSTQSIGLCSNNHGFAMVVSNPLDDDQPLDDNTVKAMLAIVNKPDDTKHYDISSDGSDDDEDVVCKKVNATKPKSRSNSLDLDKIESNRGFNNA